MSRPDLPATGPLWPELRPAASGQHSDHSGGVLGPASGVTGGDLWPQPARHAGQLTKAGGADTAAGSLSGGGRGASGGGGADGSPLRAARGRGDHAGPDFRVDVGPDGYAWWYIDGVSQDGTRALSVIGFIGSVFSPWYAWSGRRNPQNHVCLNVATYGPGGRFTMTDRGTAATKEPA